MTGREPHLWSLAKAFVSFPFFFVSFISSSSRKSDGNSSLLNEGGSASQVPQASVELVGYGSVVWPDSVPFPVLIFKACQFQRWKKTNHVFSLFIIEMRDFLGIFANNKEVLRTPSLVWQLVMSCFYWSNLKSVIVCFFKLQMSERQVWIEPNLLSNCAASKQRIHFLDFFFFFFFTVTTLDGGLTFRMAL